MNDKTVEPDMAQVPYKDMPPEQTWVLREDCINKLQQRSIEELVKRCKLAHHTDIVLRINGKYEVFQADWIKSLVMVPK